MMYTVQAAYNTDSYGVSVSYALTETSSTADSTFFGVNAFYSLDGGPSLSVGFESEDPDTTAKKLVTSSDLHGMILVLDHSA